MPGPPKTSTTLLVRLLIEDKARWDAWAKRKGKNLSDLIRKAVETAIKKG